MAYIDLLELTVVFLRERSMVVYGLPLGGRRLAGPRPMLIGPPLDGSVSPTRNRSRAHGLHRDLDA